MTFVVVANLDDLDRSVTPCSLTISASRSLPFDPALDDDNVRAIHNTCTHQQQPLHEGTLQEDDTLVCAAHASRYDLTTGERSWGRSPQARSRSTHARSKTTPCSSTSTSS